MLYNKHKTTCDSEILKRFSRLYLKRCSYILYYTDTYIKISDIRIHNINILI